MKTEDLPVSKELNGFPGGSDGKASARNAGDSGIRSLGGEDPLVEENGSPLQYSYLENSMDSRAL